MNAMVFHEHGGVEKLQIADLPMSNPGARHMLVRVHALSLNGFDPMVCRLRSSSKRSS